LPNISVEHFDGKRTVQVAAAHGMNSRQHYIVKHVLLNEDYNFLEEKMFDPINLNKSVEHGFCGKSG
jgi:superoxide reductase